MRRVLRRLALLLGAALASALAAVAIAWMVSARPVRYGALAGARSQPDSTAPADSGYRIQLVTLVGATGRRLTCALREPPASASAEGAPRFGLVLAGGRRTGREAVRFVEPGFAGSVIACDYPWAELARRRGLGFVIALPRLRREMLGTPEALELSASYLLARPGMDSARLIALGASLGAPFVSAWAGRDPRPRAVALAYFGADLAALFRANLHGEVPADWMVAPVARLFAILLAPLEPARTVGGIAPRPFLLVASEDDTWVPRRSVEKLYAAAGEPKRVSWFTGAHLRTTNALLLEALNDTLAIWLASLERR